MCGIAGIYNFATEKTVDSLLIKKMCSELVHRGPDDEGIYCKDNIGLGHRRLSIIDLGGGHQPMANEDGSVWIVFNGEIYNFQELKEELLLKGHSFKTHCDTETIIHLYEEEGEECVRKLRGMFAFAIWDDLKKKLFLARERIGKKPLHYTVFDGKILFASEIKAILQDPSVRRRIDHEALHDYLSLLYVPAPKTMFEGIQKLPAGHYLVCDKEGVKLTKYWDIDFSRTVADSEEALKEELYNKLKEAVKIRLISDVPLGAFLSGGIDSSSVVSLMSELEDKPVVTNSIGFSIKAFDELKYASLLSKRYSTEHHEYVVEPKALEILDKLVWAYDEPFGDASSIPTYYVSKMARQNVTVALSGDGGDENFAGYNRYMYSDALVRLQKVLPGFVKAGAKAVSSSLSSKDSGAWIRKINNKLQELYLSPFEMYFKMISIYKEEEKALLYSGALKEKMRYYDSRDNFRRIFDSCPSPDYISKLQYLDIKTYLCDDILVKVDRASMAVSLEVRAPMLDHKFMEFVATIPAGLKARHQKGKYIFKKAMSRNIPSEILNRSKMGFDIPMTHWLRTNLKNLVEAELFAKDGIIAELFDLEYVKKMWEIVQYANLKGFRKTDFSYRIWLLFIFSRWHKKYILGTDGNN
jgi:asparagine synthase (glutamine-hydrolysing)